MNKKRELSNLEATIFSILFVLSFILVLYLMIKPSIQKGKEDIIIYKELCNKNNLTYYHPNNMGTNYVYCVKIEGDFIKERYSIKKSNTTSGGLFLEKIRP